LEFYYKWTRALRSSHVRSHFLILEKIGDFGRGWMIPNSREEGVGKEEEEILELCS